MPTTGENPDRGSSAWLVFLLLLALWTASRCHLLAVRIFDPDEFEHLHASFCISIGQIPYRDFFEHHGPLTYYLASVFPRFLGAEPFLLLVLRGLSLLFDLGVFIAVWRTASVLSGRWNAVFAVGWLMTVPCFAEKALEWRPDVPAMFFISWAAYFLAASQHNHRGFLAGVLLGLASLCTQKVAFIATGMAASVLIAGSGSKLRNLLSLILGIALPWMFAVGFFAWQQALPDLVRCMVIYPLHWPRDPHGEATPALSLWRMMSRTQWAPGHYAALFLAIGCVGWRIIRRKELHWIPLVLTSVFHLAALPTVPAVYLQYYLLMAPLAAIIIGGALADLSEDSSGVYRKAWSIVFALTFFAFGVWMRWPYLRPFFDNYRPLPIVYGNLDLLCVAMLLIATLGWLMFGRKARWTVWMILLLPGAGRVFIPHLYWPTNHSQWQELQAVHEVVRPDEKVLDGFSGLGCLRPHAYYFWWINHHSIPLMQQQNALEPLRESVLRGEPVVIILDRELDQLRTFLGPAITRRYRPWKRLRRDLVLMLREDRAEQSK